MRQKRLHTTRQNSAASRRGLSVLEFVGCAIAVVGGIWLGAIYLGVDVRHLAHTALSEAELLDNVPPNLRPPGPQDGVTREQLVATLREELGALKSEIGSLRAGGGEAEQNHTKGTAEIESKNGGTTLPPDKEISLAYWSRLNEIALGEAALQADAQSAFDEANAAKVFAIKGRIARFAAKAVETIPHERVEPSLVQFGRQLSLWYEHGGELYDRAVQIWESATSNRGREQLNDDWRRAELHHKNEAKLLRDKAAAVRSLASRQFDVELPPFAESAAE
jgi:hypothetical protein